MTRAATYFASHGITRIERLMTDNAWAYRHSLHEAVAQLGARHLFINNTDRAAALAPWLEYYNTRRRHTALGGQPPTSRLSPTS